MTEDKKYQLSKKELKKIDNGLKPIMKMNKKELKAVVNKAAAVVSLQIRHPLFLLPFQFPLLDFNNEDLDYIIKVIGVHKRPE